ncbi:hypothetical protein [Arthrobacter sp.]|uniref:hypothetical protein n=1 Tax=Arthrobacter sp. TaxID=1667 RepID=UPI0026DFBEF6|nr:hypothetical protein [Arthrobacter sp.]MDO5752346.1 hypothetical protein [Arthrobacter sp.]
MGWFWTSTTSGRAAGNGAAYRAKAPFRVAVASVASVTCTVLVAGLAACSTAPDVPPSSSASVHTTQPEAPAVTPSNSIPPANSGFPSEPPQPALESSELSIAVTPSPGAQPQVFILVSANGEPGPGSTVPDPTAAMAALDRYGEGIFFPVPGPQQACLDVFSGPEVAVVTGTFNGRSVNATFKRTDSCQTARWQALAPLFGAVAGGTGAI